MTQIESNMAAERNLENRYNLINLLEWFHMDETW